VNMMPQPMGMPPMLPPMPSQQQVERAQAILEAVPWDDIEPILRTDERRSYNIDIETDSTVFQDAEAEKASRIEVMSAMTPWMERMIPAVQANRSLAPLMKELTMFTLGAFKLGRQLEETFEDAFDQIQNMPEQPDPEAAKLKAEMEMEEKRFQMDMQLKQADLASKQQTAQINAQGKQADLAAKQQSTEMDMQTKQLDLQLKQVSAQLDIMLKKMQMGIEQEKLGIEREKMALEGQAAQEEHQLQRESLQLQGDAQRQQSELKREDALFTSQMKRQQAQSRANERREPGR
jgi:hypothetical protein